MGIIKGIKIEKVEVPKFEKVEIPSFEFRAENYFPLVGKKLQVDLAETGVRLKEMGVTPDLKQNLGVKYIHLSLPDTKNTKAPKLEEPIKLRGVPELKIVGSPQKGLRVSDDAAPQEMKTQPDLKGSQTPSTVFNLTANPFLAKGHVMLGSLPKPVAVLLTMMGLSAFLFEPGILTWLRSHFGSLLSMMGLPLLGMVKGDDKKEIGLEGINRFDDEGQYNEAVCDLQKSEGDPKTLSWEGKVEEDDDAHFIHTIGAVERRGKKVKIDVVTIKWEDPDEEDPSNFYDLVIYTRGPLSLQSHREKHDSFVTSIKTNIKDRSTAERFHQQFVAEYQRTGSAKAAIDWLKRSQWKPSLFEVPEIHETRERIKALPPDVMNSALITDAILSHLSHLLREESPEEGARIVGEAVEELLAFDRNDQEMDPDLNRASSLEPPKQDLNLLGGEEKAAKGGEVTRFEVYDHFFEEQMRLLRDDLQVRTISYEGFDPDFDPRDPQEEKKYVHEIATFGLADRGDRVENLNVSTSGDSRSPISMFAEKSYLLSASVGNLLYQRNEIFRNESVILVEFTTNSRQIAERVHALFVEEYIKTGSYQKALDRVVRHPKGYKVFPGWGPL